MKKRVLPGYLIVLFAIFAFHGFGDEESAGIRPLRLQPLQPESLNCFGASFMMAVNIKTSFRSPFGGFSNPGPATRGADHTYDDGFNRVDSTGNALGRTTYWGYQNASQYDPSNGGTMAMHSASGSAASNNRDDAPYLGFELTYSRKLGGGEKWNWGLETAFNYMNVQVRDNNSVNGSGTLTSDAYQLAGVVPLSPGYTGPYRHDPATGPVPTLGDAPTRSQSSLSFPVAGDRDFDANIFGWRLGPYLGIPLSSKVGLRFSGGLSLAEINSDFRFNETARYAVNGTTLSLSTRGSGSDSDLLVGGYLEGKVSYAFNHAVGLFAGARYQSGGTYTHRLPGGHAASLDLTQSVFVTLGLSYSF